MIELTEVKHPSTNVHSIGFEGDKRGDLHVQFCDKEGRLTVRGFYRDVQRAIFNALEADRAPGKFISQNLKNRFEWVAFDTGEAPEITAARQNPDTTLPDNFLIPGDIPYTIEAIDACVNAQRLPAEPKGLF